MTYYCIQCGNSVVKRPDGICLICLRASTKTLRQEWQEQVASFSFEDLLKEIKENESRIREQILKSSADSKQTYTLDLPKEHEREAVLRQAIRDMSDALDNVKEQHNLSWPELAYCIHSVAQSSTSRILTALVR